MKNKIINLNVPIADLDGNRIEGASTLGKILANDLVTGSEGDPLKFFDWAMRFNKGEIVELDRSDYEKLKEFVKASKRMTILVKGQLLPLIENDKTESEEKFEKTDLK
jgi:hypothetical protein